MFKVFRIRLYYNRILRGIYIFYTFASFFVVNWLSSLRYGKAFVLKKYKRNGVVMSMPERLRIIIEQLGPTFVKFGQILADRPDIVSEKLRIELKKLQSMAEPFDNDVALRLIAEELGAPIDHYFEEIHPICIGAASIGQVYRGRLKEGDEVVIKIQRPDIEHKIDLDLELLKYFAKQLVEEYPGFNAVDIVGFVEEFGEALKQEMDYTSEAANIIRFGEIFKDVPYCKIPTLYLQHCSPKMLVMELIKGVEPDSVERIREAGLDPHQVAVNGTHILMTMIFKYGFFHADPHPGNLYIQEGNRIALIDFGMVGVLKPSHMEFLAGFTLGLSNNDARTITDALLTLCGKKFFADKDDLEFAVQDMLMRHSSFSYEKMNFSSILNESIKIILKYELRIPASIYLLLKALACIERFGAQLYPDISLPAIIRPYAQELILKRFAPSNIAHELYDAAKDYVSLIRDFPAEVNEILFHLKQGKLKIDFQVHDHELLGRSIGGVFALGFLLAFMLAVSAAMSIWGKSPVVGNVMFGISSFFSFVLIIRLFFKTKV